MSKIGREILEKQWRKEKCQRLGWRNSGGKIGVKDWAGETVEERKVPKIGWEILEKQWRKVRCQRMREVCKKYCTVV